MEPSDRRAPRQAAPIPPVSTPPDPTQAPVRSGGTNALPPPPDKVRDAREFIRRDGSPEQRRIEDVRKGRSQEREGDRIVIREGDRTMIREGNRTIIRHNESSRFAVGAGNIRTERRGENTATVIERGNGVRIISVVAPDGRLVQRIRRDRNGRDIVIIDNRFAGPERRDMFIRIDPPPVRMPRERYIVDMRGSTPGEIQGVFEAPPVSALPRRYTLEQVRYNSNLRDYMPRVDMDVNFESGSWQLSPAQIGQLAAIADGLKRAVSRNPREVFIVEGHTDAVGSEEDNLSLSDRRAEAIAVGLTEQFQVPPENLVTQGYGEQHLKVQTEGSEAVNRRVTLRRITPLIAESPRSPRQ